MRINCITIEDEPLALKKIWEFIEQVDYLKILEEFDNAIDAIGYLKENSVDLIFLDIRMKKLSGIKFLESLQNKPKVIITSAYDEYALRGYELDVADYLLKPFSEDRFNEALKRSFNHLQDKFEHDSVIKNIIDHNEKKIEFLERVVIKEGSKISIIPVETIKWIEAQDDYVKINCEQGRFLKQKTMKYFENHLDENNFIRIHRSYIINVDFIQHLEQTGKESYQLILKNGKQLPVSKTGLSKLRNTL